MQLIAEAYDLLRRAWAPQPAEIAGHLRRVERGRPRVVPDRDHRRRARARRRRDRQAVRRRRPRPGRAEGHRPLDRAERPRPGRADHRHRRGDVRPFAVRLAPAARGRRGSPPGQRRRVGGRRPGRRSSRTSPGALRLQDRRLRAGLRPDRRGAARSTTGTSTGAPWPRSGAAAASSGRASSTGSARPTTRARPAAAARRRRTSPSAVGDGGRGLAAGGGRGRRGRACPTPAFSSSLAYYDGLRARAAAGGAHPGPARLLRRAHLPAGRRRGTFHTQWTGDRTEIEA